MCFLCLFGDVTIAGEGLQFLIYARHLQPLSSRVLYRAPPTVTRGIRFLVYWQSPWTRDIHTYCRAFGSRTVTTCFNDLGLSLLGFEHPNLRLRLRSNPLYHRCG